MKVKIDNSNVRNMFTAAKYVAAGILIALSPVLLGWLVYCTADGVFSDKAAELCSVLSGAVMTAILACSLGFYLDDACGSATFKDAVSHMVKTVVIAFISMFVPFMVMVYLFSQLGPLGVIITILGLIGLGGGLICYRESNENPDRQ